MGAATPVTRTEYASCAGAERTAWRERYQWGQGEGVFRWTTTARKAQVVFRLGYGWVGMWRELEGPYRMAFWENAWYVSPEVSFVFPRYRFLMGVGVRPILWKSSLPAGAPFSGLTSMSFPYPVIYAVPYMEVGENVDLVLSVFSPGMALVWRKGDLEVSGFWSVGAYPAVAWLAWPALLFFPGVVERSAGPWGGVGVFWKVR